MKPSKFILINAVPVLVLALIPVFVKRTDVLTWLIFTLLYITLSQSWNVIGGFAGQQSLGHAAFFGIGALSARFLWLYGLPLPLSLVAGALGAAVFALIIGFPAFRLKGVYFVIGTLVLAEILRTIFDTVLPRASVLPSRLLNTYSLTPRYYLSLLIAVIAVWAVWWISRSRMGFGFMSVREDEDAAEASGVNTRKYKLLAFLVSTAMAGLAGGVFGYFSSAAQPGALFSAVWTFDAVIIVFVGGVGTVLGPIVGSCFFILLQQILSLYLPMGMHVLVFGILFILVVLFLPRGLIGLLMGIRDRSRRG
ncbi:MAG: branched-chain amino acid ABC transporter permease [Deltaproteobacteria bacterium]|nr:branched-chain amino acid ABC transporter permease [Deltaproteobacteria bacterium]